MKFADIEEKKERNLIPPTDKLEKMKKRKAKLDKDLALLEEMGVTQYNRTDPDAKLMVKPAHNLMAYNSQIVVDEKFKFIVATDVSSDNNDHGKLYEMAQKVKEITNHKKMTILADTGYYSAKEIQKCQKSNINAIVAIPNINKAQKDRGYYLHSDFKYDKNNDCFICPNRQRLTKSNSIITKKNGTKGYVYRAGSKTCNSCPLRDNCIPQKTAYKRISRSEYDTTIIAYKEKMKTSSSKKLLKQRGALVEHPFGTIKQTLGWSHFLVRGKEKVSGENALIMFTYNFRRLLNLIGITLFRKLLKTLKDGNIEEIKAEIVAYIAYFKLYFLYFFRMMFLLDFRSQKCYYWRN